MTLLAVSIILATRLAAGLPPKARPKVLDDRVEALSPACSRRKDAGLKALCDDLAAA